MECDLYYASVLTFSLFFSSSLSSSALISFIENSISSNNSCNFSFSMLLSFCSVSPKSFSSDHFGGVYLYYFGFPNRFFSGFLFLFIFLMSLSISIIGLSLFDFFASSIRLTISFFG